MFWSQGYHALLDLAVEMAVEMAVGMAVGAAVVAGAESQSLDWLRRHGLLVASLQMECACLYVLQMQLNSFRRQQ